MAITPAADAGPSAPPPQTQAQAAQVFKRLHPRAYLAQYLDSGYRPDGRRVGEWRGVSVVPGSISSAHGSALVRLGNTTVLCGVTAETAAPTLADPAAGYVVPNLDLPALCSPRFRPGPPGDEAQRVSAALKELLVSSNTLDPHDLVISPGKAVWVLYLDLVCINYDSNIFDAAMLALLGALRDTRLPRATYDPTSGTVVCSPPFSSLSASGSAGLHPLPLRCQPLACTFGSFGAHLLPDPTAFEAPYLDAETTVALDEAGRACWAKQLGLGGVKGKRGEEVWDEVWGQAEKRAREMREVLEQAVPSP